MRLRARYLLLVDLAATALCGVAAFVVRYEALLRVGPYIERNVSFFVAILLVRPVVYYLFGLYRCWWRYASVREMVAIVEAATVGSILTAALLYGFAAPEVDGVRVISRSVLLLEWMLNLLAVGSIRIVVRLAQSRSTAAASQALRGGSPTKRVLIMGAGDAGAMVVREMLQNATLGYLPVGFLDDNPAKRGAQIHGVPVLGSRSDIPRLAAEEAINEVVIAMPTASGSAIREVRAISQRCGVATKTIPGLYELLNGSVNIAQIREVRIEDLLRREPVHCDLAAVAAYVSQANVLVTGAGGSIGSELCRQIALCKPQRLLLLGHGEGSIYNIWMELAERAPQLPVVPLIADVRDVERVRRLFEAYRPAVVFHAAAHKHVPLMEGNPEEALTTNVWGTDSVLRAAEASGVDRFVLISSDKAVNPTSIMGASKRIAEVLVQSAAKRSGRKWAVVRFGNVLGSRGSVVPLFERQIAAGGPVTVTHPAMTRYFMTIPEAVQLVLQAGALGAGGEIFVLDMGEQIRIEDLAHDLISLSGLTVGEDIEIRYTGIRRGEKLFEELFGIGEERGRTAHDKIWVTHGRAIPAEATLWADLGALLAATRRDDRVQMVAALRHLIPSYSGTSEQDETAVAKAAKPTVDVWPGQPVPAQSQS